MLEIHAKGLPPDIVVLEIVGTVTLGGESKQLEWAIRGSDSRLLRLVNPRG
jgi:hypothetical protein